MGLSTSLLVLSDDFLLLLVDRFRLLRGLYSFSSKSTLSIASNSKRGISTPIRPNRCRDSALGIRRN